MRISKLISSDSYPRRKSLTTYRGCKLVELIEGCLSYFYWSKMLTQLKAGLHGKLWYQDQPKYIFKHLQIDLSFSIAMHKVWERKALWYFGLVRFVILLTQILYLQFHILRKCVWIVKLSRKSTTNVRHFCWSKTQIVVQRRSLFHKSCRKCIWCFEN